MPITLTDLPLPWQVTCTLNDYGIDQTGKNGGPQIRSPRIGSRWSVKFSALPSLSFACGGQLLAARISARCSGETVICPWPQASCADPFLPTGLLEIDGGGDLLEISPGGPFLSIYGPPIVVGAGQVGEFLSASGFTAGSTIPAGVFFSVVVSGRSYLYVTAGAVVADGSGNATLPIAPWLRASPAAGAALIFAAPQIEGFIRGPSEDWTVAMDAWVGLPEFSIDELQ